MNTRELVEKYASDSFVKTISEHLNANKRIKLKGLAGSSDALLSSAISSTRNGISLYILHDREEADYFFTDLNHLIPDSGTHFFPTSYKKAYQFDDTENANVLMRAEVLSIVNQRVNETINIVTYPEALVEKVINKQSLVDNTFQVSLGEKVNVEFLSELLATYGFEKSDFVYEPGQYAIRGGIIDVFSFSLEKPYRLELFGNELESIRLFDVDTQISSESISKATIVPDVQTKLLREKRQSFLNFLPKDTLIWIKDFREMIDIIDKGFEKAQESFNTLLSESEETQVALNPEDIYNTSERFSVDFDPFSCIEFGKRFHFQNAISLEFNFSPQPHFHKNFDLLGENLKELQLLGFENYLFAESPRQIDRLSTIFEEIDPDINIIGIEAGLREGFVDHLTKTACYTDHQIFDRFHRAKTRDKFSKAKAITLNELKTLHTGDYVVHIDHGVGRFAGLDTVDFGGNKQEALRLVYRDDDLLYVNIHALHKISRYSGKEGMPPAINKLGSQDWENKKKKVKRKVKDIAKDLIKLYAKRKSTSGFSFSPDNFLQAELESSFIYQDTPDQAKATEDVKVDMQQNYPMDRLVCGDVGFGKTEVAVRAAFKAVNDSKQVAILVPTTILAMQHFHTFRDRLSGFPIIVEYVNRFKSAKEITRIKKELASGTIDILIGTHRIVNVDMEFKNLGLMVIDEEQKFGVKVKEKLKEFRINIDALTLTATPIPRTLHFSLMGARDLSIISTPPPNRRPVTTEIHEFNESIIRDAVSHEIRRRGQVFFVHNRISDIEKLGNLVYKLVPDARIGIAHGQMEGKLLEKVMMRFIEGEYDVLISTNIIESGLDIPNANTIIINRAHMFGLSDLHQMRGRVGRSNTKAYCYLLTPPTSGLSSEARKRLITLEEFSQLGDGFKVAMRDLDIRGAGNLLGSEQSGFINDMGFEMYHKILDEAVNELKETEFKELFASEILDEKKLLKLVQDCIIETDLELIIPVNYVSNTSERLNLYNKLDNIKDENQLNEFRISLIDRFGQPDQPVEDLIKSVKLRWAGISLGFEKIIVKSDKLRCYVSQDKDDSYFQSDSFGGIVKYAQLHAKRCQLKEYKNKLIISVQEANSINDSIKILEEMVEIGKTIQ